MYSTPLKNFIELYNTRGGIIQLSRDPVIRFESTFFCLIALIELFKIKKRSLEIFAKNGFFKYCLVPGGTGSDPRFLQRTRGTMARDIRYYKFLGSLIYRYILRTLSLYM